MSAVIPTDALVRQQDVVDAVRFLGTQAPRGMTHELVITAKSPRNPVRLTTDVPSY